MTNGKNHQKRKNSETSRNITKLAKRPSTKNQIFGKTEKIIQSAKTQKRLEICQNGNSLFWRVEEIIEELG